MNAAAQTLPELVDRVRQCQAAGAMLMVRPSELGFILEAAAQARLYEHVSGEVAGHGIPADGAPSLFAFVIARGRPLTLASASALLPAVIDAVREQVFSLIEPERVDPPCDVEA